jgi:hypothetical protein
VHPDWETDDKQASIVTVRDAALVGCHTVLQ